MYAIACAFRWGVALVGEFFYWAFLTPLWDPFSGTGRRRFDEAVICERGRHVALSNIFFVKMFCIKEFL